MPAEQAAARPTAADRATARPHGCGSDGGGAGRRGAYQESQGEGSACGGGAVTADSGGGEAGIAGNGAVSGWDSAAPPVTCRPQTGQN